MSDPGPTVFNGRYELHRRLGRGGMAEVFLARDQLLDRPVAVKVLFPEFATDPAFVERFRREATAAANLNHPNIVGVYDWGEADGTYFIVMEYVDGRSLSEILRAEGEKQGAILQAEGRREAAFRDAEAREREAEAEAKATTMVSDAIASSGTQALNYFIAQKYIEAFKALASRNINIRAITTSEIKFSVLIDAAYTELAVRTLHSLYGLDKG